MSHDKGFGRYEGYSKLKMLIVYIYLKIFIEKQKFVLPKDNP